MVKPMKMKGVDAILIQGFLDSLLSGEKKRSVTDLVYWDTGSERFIQVVRKMGFKDTTIPITEDDSLEDIMRKVKNHPAVY